MYGRILGLCNSEKAISEGKMFDLMYVNYDNPSFNPHRHFAFIRSHEDEYIVILVNFSDTEAHVAVNIPDHAFEYLGMPRGHAEAGDRLSGQTSLKTLSDITPFTTHIPPHGAVMWKFNKDSVKPM